jgi:SAM-dependent methyltransferase
MEIEWKVDRDAKHLLFADINEKVVSLRERGVKTVLDLGGGSGWYTWQLKNASPATDVVVADINIVSDLNSELGYVRSDMLAIPFKDKAFDAVVAHASLHHVHDSIDDVLKDIRRVLDDGGTFLTAEPCAGNALTNMAKKVALTSQHDAEEMPFPPQVLIDHVKKHFEIEDVGYYFYLSYLMPHLAGRAGPGAKGAALFVTGFLHRLDRKMLADLPGLREKSAYISITARKK